MSSNLVLPTTFDASLITFTPPKILDSGGKVVSLLYDGRPLTTQTASMVIPYGMNVYDKAGPTSYSVDLSFRGVEDNPKIKAFHQMLTAVDEMMIEAGIANGQAWFKMPNPSREVIKAFYTPSVKISLDKDGKPKPYPPTLKLKLQKKNNAFLTQFYNTARIQYEGIPVENLLVKGARGTFLIKPQSIWFAGSKFGISWVAVQAIMDSIPDYMNRGCLIADEEDGAQQSGRPTGRVQQASVPGRRSAPVVVDEDEEEDDVVESVMPAQRSVAQPVATVDDEDEEEDVVEAPVVPRKAATTVVKKAVKRVAAK